MISLNEPVSVWLNHRFLCIRPRASVLLYWRWLIYHDVIKWRHFPRHLPFVRGIHRIPLTKASDKELWCFLWSAPEQSRRRRFESSLWRHCNVATYVCITASEVNPKDHYDDVIMTTMASQITSLTIVYSTVYSGAYQRKHQSSASLAFARGIHRRPANSPHKWPITRKMFPCDGVIMCG